MTAEDRKAWLAGLKPGDEVFVESSGYVSRLVKVARLTPSGRIIVNSAGIPDTFRPDGWRDAAFGRERIEPPTPARREALERSNHLAKLCVFPWRVLPLPALREIVAVVKANEPKPEVKGE